MRRRRRQEMGWPDFVFALHNNEDRGPRMLAPISKHTGQRLGDSLDRNSHPQRRIGLLSTLLPTSVTTGGGRLSKRRRRTRLTGLAAEMSSIVWRSLRLGLNLVLGLAVAGASAVSEELPVTETIVMVRHGEKPAGGLGQLDCQGLNRALALPAVIEKLFGRPDAIFAPDPAQSKEDYGRLYNYVRPLATIEPTAIVFGLPVDASIGVSNLDALRHNAVVVVAWEHAAIATLARLLVAEHGGDPSIVPDWQGDDFDSMYIVKLTQTGAGTAVTFDRRREGLDGQPTVCPGRAPQ